MGEGGHFRSPLAVAMRAGSAAAICTLLAVLLGALLADVSPAASAESLPRL
jgi:hypothetical protein